MVLTYEVLAIINEVMGQNAVVRKHGSQAVYFCPFCNHYKRKLEVNLETGLYHCWVCDVKGKSFGSFLRKMKAPREMRERLVAITGDLRILQKRKKSLNPDEVVLPEEFYPLCKERDSIEYKNALAYMLDRGVTMDDIIRYNIGYCETGEYQFRVVIPSYDEEGKLNFFVTRHYYNIPNRPSYKNCPYNRDIVGFESFVNYDIPINIVEGAFDAFAVRQNVIPLFGKFMSKKLILSLIGNQVRRVNMILDNDALKDALKNSRRLMSYGIEVHLIRLDGKDPSAIGFGAVNRMIRNSKSLSFRDIIKYKLAL